MQPLRQDPRTNGGLAAWLPSANLAVSILVCLYLYILIVLDAWRHEEWLHVFTLTPLMPFLGLMGLAWRHRRNAVRSWVILGFTLLVAGVFLPLFWWAFTGPTAPTTKALVKGAVPIGTTLGVAILGGLLEWHLRAESRRDGSRRKPSAFAKY